MWARNFSCCRNCGTTKYPHLAKGYCNRCYLKEYRNENAEEISRNKKKWYILNKDLVKQKQKREKIHFDSKREKALKRDNYKCVKCGSQNSLVVHHKDGQGRGKKNKNNKLKNLITLCRACHVREHRKELLEKRTANQQKQWSYKWEKCVWCGSTKNKHAGHGFCKNCSFGWKKKRRILIKRNGKIYYRIKIKI